MYSLKSTTLEHENIAMNITAHASLSTRDRKVIAIDFWPDCDALMAHATDCDERPAWKCFNSSANTPTQTFLLLAISSSLWTSFIRLRTRRMKAPNLLLQTRFSAYAERFAFASKACEPDELWETMATWL